MRKGKTSRVKYIRKTKEYRECFDKEKLKHEKGKWDKISQIKTGEEAQKYNNKYRRKKENIDRDIDLQKWKLRFVEQLDGTIEKVRIEKEMNEEEKKKVKERE